MKEPMEEYQEIIRQHSKYSLTMLLFLIIYVAFLVWLTQDPRTCEITSQPPATPYTETVCREYHVKIDGAVRFPGNN